MVAASGVSPAISRWQAALLGAVVGAFLGALALAGVGLSVAAFQLAAPRLPEQAVMRSCGCVEIAPPRFEFVWVRASAETELPLCRWPSRATLFLPWLPGLPEAGVWP